MCRTERVGSRSDRLDDVQRAHIETILHTCGWLIDGRRNAAERLGLHPNTLRARMKKLGIARPAMRGNGGDMGKARFADGQMGILTGGCS